MKYINLDRADDLAQFSPFDAERRARRGKGRNERQYRMAAALADWWHEAGARSIFLVGTGDGFYLAYWRACGFEVAGCDLPESETSYRLCPAVDWTAYRIVRTDALDLTRAECSGADVLVSDACFEAMVPWRADGSSTIPKYAGGGPLALLGRWVRTLGVPRWAFIEPDWPELRAQWGAPVPIPDPVLSALSSSTRVPLVLYTQGFPRAPSFAQETGRER